MSFSRVCSAGLLLCCLPVWSVSAPRRPDENQAVVSSESNFTIAVADFAGADKELSHFLAETLLTNLQQSERLHLVERNEIRQAFAEMKLQSTGLTEPKQIKQLGRLVSADHVIVGSFLLRDDVLTINARLLDVKTGQLSPGGAASVSGSRSNLLQLTMQLARQFHKRVTGAELDGESEAPAPYKQRSAPKTRFAPPQPSGPIADDLLAICQQKNLIPAAARPNGPVSERQLAALITRVAQQLSTQSETPLEPAAQPNAPVSRLRVLASLMKLFEPPDRIEGFRADESRPATPDDRDTPTWGKPFVAAALVEGWWHEDAPFKARDNATWAFAASLLVKMPLDIATAAPKPNPAFHASADAFTGLIIDADDLNVERAMSPRILDEQGSVVYPDPKHLPDYDFLLDKGLAAYSASPEQAKRAGENPILVHALSVGGTLNADLIVSNETAERIREADRQGKFLSRWAVCFLVRPRSH